jgi:cell division protein FtsI/penicillin-binding protein 2
VVNAPDGRRLFIDEFYGRAGLAPLLGDRSRLRGVEAALASLRPPATPADSTQPLELAVDGDLQRAVQSIVDTATADLTAAEGAAPVTVVVLDGRTGEVLAAANGPRDTTGNGVPQPSAWETGAQLTRGVENSAFQRRSALGSTLKVAGIYALVNSGIKSRHSGGATVMESLHDDSAYLYLARAGATGLGHRTGRRCLTGRGPERHSLPADAAAFDHDLVVRRFAQSCNSFFVLTGFVHADTGARLRPYRGGGPAPALGELGMQVDHPDSVTLVLPNGVSLADRVRAGLQADAAPGAGGPRSIYGILVRSGFRPQPGVPAPVEDATAFGFGRGGRPVTIPLSTWFAGDVERGIPGLQAGRDFSYPEVPSPAQLDERGSTTERYGDSTVRVPADTSAGLPETQYAQLLIGQGQIAGSALALSVLFAPAARDDGLAVRPCLFRAACDPHQAAKPVVDRRSPAGAALPDALRAVITSGGTAWNNLRARRRLAALYPAWGGKTGTYEEEDTLPTATRARWHWLLAHACGVEALRGGTGAAALANGFRTTAPSAAAAVERLATSPAGAALGARACEDPRWPLNPAGIHGYGAPAQAADLDTVAAAVTRAASQGRRERKQYHAFVLAALPGGGRRVDGIVVAVLVDRADPRDRAVMIGTEAAAAVERWARVIQR